MPDTATMNGARWTLGEGVVNVSGRKANSGSTYVRAVIDSGVSDATVSGSFTLGWGGNSAGLAFRATDPNNFVYFRITGNGWTLGYVTTVNGVAVGTTVATGKATFSATAAYRLTAVCQGPSVTLLVNGALIYSGPVMASITGTCHGFGSGVASPFTVSDFQVTP
jgi:hypothetical protein